MKFDPTNLERQRRFQAKRTALITAQAARIQALEAALLTAQADAELLTARKGKTTHAPPPSVRYLTCEESGKPGPGSTIAEHDAYNEKYGRVPLFPMAVKDLLNDEALVGELVHSVVSAASARRLNAEQFFAAIDRLLAHVRQPEDTLGHQFPFATHAKRMLKEFRGSLPRALALFTALDAQLTSRR